MKAVKCALRSPNLTLMAFDKAIVGRLEGDWSPVDSKSFEVPDGILVPSKIMEEGDLKNCELKLGDFAQLGVLLRNMSSSDDKKEQ